MNSTGARLRGAAAIVGLFCLLAVTARAADPVREVHGASDAYAESGVALAWAVLRGIDEASTKVTLRIVADPLRYPFIEVAGSDPFTRAERQLLARMPTRGLPDLVVPRAHFADFPRTELRFLSAEGAPAVVVYYLGVPDTTPEFAAAAALAKYLDDRIARARSSTGEKP